MIILTCEREIKLIKEAMDYLKGWGLQRIKLRPCPIKKRIELGESFAAIRVIRAEERRINGKSLPMELNFEKKRLSNCSCGKGVIYDGPLYSALLRAYIFPDETSWLKSRPVFVTMDYIASFEEPEKRYHLRYAIFSFPVIISLPGILEAPAKPRDFYIYQSLGIPMEALKKQYLTGLDDPRYARALAGILLQAWFYYETGEPFCPDPHCSLYNAHWQKELLIAQKDTPYILCKKHYHILRGSS